MRLRVEVVVWRGTIAESRHRVQAAVADPDGRLILGTEESTLATTFRSAAKPFQLLPLVERGHAERWGWSDEELAVMAASHTGGPYHVELVSRILAKLGLGEEHLACGYHEPLDPESRARIASGEAPRSPIYNNCSGKHAGMLCLALSEGWPTAGYERAEHPLQRLMRSTVAEMCGLRVEEVAVAVDGCSVSVFAVPLEAMARSFARLAAAGEKSGGARERALHRIRVAMQSYPRAVGGDGRLTSALMSATAPRLVAKGGAEGLECIGIPGSRLGIAVKCEDGQGRAVGPAVVGLLQHLGEISSEELGRLDDWRSPPVRNHSGLVTGRIEATVRALSPTAP